MSCSFCPCVSSAELLKARRGQGRRFLSSATGRMGRLARCRTRSQRTCLEPRPQDLEGPQIHI